jgi:hypothetical protein
MINPRRGGTDSLRCTSRVLQWLSAIAILAVANVPARAQTTSDVVPPTLQAFSFTPTSIDVSAGPRLVALSAVVTDDLSGASAVWVFFRSPTTNQAVSVALPRTGGTALDGTWSGNIAFPQFAESGVWTVTQVQVFDFAGNTSVINTNVLASRLFPTQVMVTSVPDVTPPTVTAAMASPSAIDVSSADQTVMINLQISDDIAGVAFTPCSGNQGFTSFAITLRSPTGAQNRYISNTGFTLFSGTRINGTWRASFSMPKSSESGTWTLQSIVVHDCAGNTRSMSSAQIGAAGIQIALNVTSTSADLQAPTLADLSFVPITINTSTGSQAVKIRMRVLDNLAGVDFSPDTPNLSFFAGGIEFRSPSGNQAQSAVAFNPFNLVSGTVLDGTWEGTITLPQFSEEGTWKIDYFGIKDRTRNLRNYTVSALASLGFPTTFEVIKPSLIVDGTVGTGGGAVNDQVFGDRASVFFPAGALSGTSQVAIDVLSKPLDVESPTGFTGPGTLYVNIHVTPAPNFPLLPPGLTVILPIEHPMIAGSQLSLYKVDTNTGGLIPAINVFGGPVLGHVNADGLSATFFGIASLSTVVGLVPEALNVGVDIKPGDSQNTINLKSRGVMPVAILSSATFDARTIIPESILLAGTSVRLKGNGQPAFSFEDVNGDGRLDLLLQFDTQSLDISSNDTQAHLTGRTSDGLRIVGHDSIRIVPQ